MPWRQKYSNKVKSATALCLSCTPFRIIVDQVSSCWTSQPAIQSKRNWFLTGGGGEQTTLSRRNAVHHQFEVLSIRYDTHHQYKVSANKKIQYKIGENRCRTSIRCPEHSTSYEAMICTRPGFVYKSFSHPNRHKQCKQFMWQCYLHLWWHFADSAQTEYCSTFQC